MSILLAKVFGIYGIAIGIALLLKPERFHKLATAFFKDDSLTMLGGVLSLLIGAVIVSLNNVWALNWHVLITILGYWALIKGLGLLLYPQYLEKLRDWLLCSPACVRIAGAFWLVLGSFFLFKGIS